MSFEEKDTSTNNPTEEIGLPEEESTIFSAPAAHNDKVKKPTRVKNIIIAAVALLLVAAITVTVVLTVPVLNGDEDTSSDDPEIRLLTAEMLDGVDKVTLIREDDSLTFLTYEKENAATDDDGNQTTELSTEWCLSTVDPSLTSDSLVKSAVESMQQLYYTREISKDKNDGADYGFESPTYTIEFYKDGSDEAYITTLVGARSPEGSGYYITASNTDSVYYGASSQMMELENDELDFAESDSVDAVTADTGTTNTYYNEGALVSFDKLVVYSKSLGDTYTIIAKEADNVKVFNGYHISDPVVRPANDEKVSNIIAIFSSGLSSSGCYSYTTTDYDMKRFGLDKPEFSATIYVEDVVKSVYATLQDDGYYAVYCPDNKTIMKIDASSLAVASYTKKDLYNSFLFIESIVSASSLTVQSGGETIKFDVITEYNEENDSDDLKGVSVNGTELTLSNFQSYYQFLLGVTAVSYETADLKGLTPETVITLAHKEGTADTVIEYYKVSAGRYAVVVDGAQMGLISSSNHGYVVKYAQNVAQDKTYNEK